jgi:hypothetical protein
MRKIAAALLAACACLAQAQDAPVSTRQLEAEGKKPLDQATVVKLVTGNTLRHVKLASSIRYDMLYQASGNRIFWTGGPGIGKRFEGWYKIVDGKRCELSGGGGEVCFTLYPADAGRYFLCDSNGKCDWILSVETGNPLGID